MRKILVALLVILCLGSGAAYLHFSGVLTGKNESKIDVKPGEEFPLKFKFPLGQQLEYDVNIARRTTVSTKEGKVIFAVSVNMDQVILNHKDMDKSFKQFHLDVFRDITATEAKQDDKPLDAAKRNAQLENEAREFRTGAYVFNEFELKYDGLPVEPKPIEQESDLLMGQLEHLQYFPGDSRKVGDKWEYVRKLGKYTSKLEFEFTSLVMRSGYKCAKLTGTISIADKLEKVELFPTIFTLWLAVDEGAVIATEITQKWRAEVQGTWFVREMTINKELRVLRALSPERLALLSGHVKKLIDTERDFRTDKRERAKDPERKLYLENTLKEFGPDEPTTKGITFILDMIK